MNNYIFSRKNIKNLKPFGVYLLKNTPIALALALVVFAGMFFMTKQQSEQNQSYTQTLYVDTEACTGENQWIILNSLVSRSSSDKAMIDVGYTATLTANQFNILVKGSAVDESEHKKIVTEIVRPAVEKAIIENCGKGLVGESSAVVTPVSEGKNLLVIAPIVVFIIVEFVIAVLYDGKKRK